METIEEYAGAIQEVAATTDDELQHRVATFQDRVKDNTSRMNYTLDNASSVPSSWCRPCWK